MQRLGHLLEHLGHDAVTGAMLEALRARGSLPWTELDRQEAGDPDFEVEPQKRDPRWRVIVRRAPEGRRMIPAQNVVAWGNVVPWADQRQVEQDLIISRVLVEIFSDELLRDALRCRGGTALNKLHFPAPVRYSEDIDLNRTSAGRIGPILDRLRAVLEPWLGRAQFDQSPVAPKFRFRVEAEDDSGGPIRLKIEINTREIEAFDAPAALPLKVANPWFSGTAPFPHSPARKCWRPNCAHCCSATRGAISTTLRTRSRSSRASITTVSSRCSGGICNFPARPSRGHRPTSVCSPSWPSRASCSMCAHCYRPFMRKL